MNYYEGGKLLQNKKFTLIYSDSTVRVIHIHVKILEFRDWAHGWNAKIVSHESDFISILSISFNCVGHEMW